MCSTLDIFTLIIFLGTDLKLTDISPVLSKPITPVVIATSQTFQFFTVL